MMETWQENPSRVDFGGSQGLCPHFVTVFFFTWFGVAVFNYLLVWVDGGTWFKGQTMRSELWRQHKDHPKAPPQL